MSKSAFIDRVSKKGKLSRAEAKRMVELVFGEVAAGLKASKKEGRYSIGTFGNFSVVKRAARKGRNPRTGAVIDIPASIQPKFKAGKGLKEAVN